MPKIYISYRRSDSAATAGRIYDYLVQRYRRADVWFDLPTIPTGVSFLDSIRDAIARSSVMLVIIGPHWLGDPESLGVSGVGDVIRSEIEIAFELHLPIIPVLVDGAQMPSYSQLPESLAFLTRLNAARIRSGADFRYDMERLQAAISSTQSRGRPSWWPFARGRERSVELDLPPDSLTPPISTRPAQNVQPLSLFISYKAEERPTVSALASALSEHGYAVWYDQRLLGGQHWWDEILANIRRADVFLFALTPESLESVPCQREYGYAHALGKPILPLKMNDAVDLRYLPAELQQIEVIPYLASDMDAFTKLSLALATLPPAAALPSRLPDPPPAPISPLGEMKEQLDAQTMTLEQQALILHRLRSMYKKPESSDDALRLLRQLAEHPDARTSITDEIRQLIG